MLKDPQNWDEYWNKHGKKSIYGFFAEIYRKLFIKRSLNYFIFKNFKKNSELLHAGCGSGQVDEDISNQMKITGLDISKKALEIYKFENKNNETIYGSIFEIPVKNESFDGIYNLGVMEHFNEKEINSILNEFHRILKKEGKLVIFWPPEFGSSVIVLKGIHFVLNSILKKNVKLHPDEISRIKSKNETIELFKKNNFNVKEFYFGGRDFFTQVCIVAEKTNDL